MKFMHLSDLHIGKRVNEFSMLEDQKYIFDQILSLADREKVDGVWIAGDVYDKTVPSAEAVQLFDDFLTGLVSRGLLCFIISGNHDSPERIAFGARLVDRCGVYLSPVFGGDIAPVSLKDAYGEVRIYLLPFLKPAYVRQVYPQAQAESYQDAVKLVLDKIRGRGDGQGEEEGAAETVSQLPAAEASPRTVESRPEQEEKNVGKGEAMWDSTCRNVLLAHQFVIGASRCESEEISVGGIDQVSAEVFDGFDYVALGHIHTPQSIGRDTVRYCGTPLKYSFSEASTEKSVTIVELKEKGNVEVCQIPLHPGRDMREIRGTYMELTALENYQGTPVEDYLHITLTDEEDIPDALGKLRSIYPHIMKLDYDNLRTRRSQLVEAEGYVEQKSPLQLFEELYELQNNQKMSEEQRKFAGKLMEEIWQQ